MRRSFALSLTLAVCTTMFSAVALPAAANETDAEPSTAADTAAEESAVRTASPTNVRQLRQEVRDALKAQAKADEQDQPATVARLIGLRNSIAKDTTLSEHMRTQLTTKLHSRLARLRKSIVKDVWERQARIENAQRDDAAPAHVRAIEVDQAILAQWDNVLGQFGDDIAGGGSRDNGQALINLIEETICPDSWESNGGTGRMVFFGNLQAVVVSATGT